MSYELPKPSPLALCIQSTCMIAFAVCLYLFAMAFQTNNHYTIALNELQERKQQLNQAYEQVDRYMKFMDSSPYYQKNLGEPQWEKVDETWDDLAYDKLVQRLSSLYRQDRPFILDYFSAAIKTEDNQSQDSKQLKQENMAEQKNRRLIFHLQGYYLCPCQ
jgi:galactokinase